MYSFKEVIDLFDLTDPNNITQEQLKQAKMKVLRTHPDKSRLPPEYFLFYKKAFEIIIEFYNNQQRITKEVPTTPMKYSQECPDLKTGTGSGVNNKQNTRIIETIDSIPRKKFQETFNDLFEKNQMGKKIVNKNEWFSKEKEDDMDIFLRNNNVTNLSAINGAFEKIKEKQQGMVVYKGLREIPTSSISCANLYEDIDDECNNDSGSADYYIESDPFSRLKFEDIKKVHRNETVFTVGEKDYDKVQKYSSVDEFVSSRNVDNISLKTEEESRRILKEKELEFQNKMILKQYQSKKKEMEMETKNKSVLSYFLQLTPS
jgi:hypothetical protein